MRLAKEIQSRAAKINKIMPIYLELNLSGEVTKHGWQVKSKDQKVQFTNDVKRILELEYLEVKGLMTMAPYSLDPENSREYFIRLRSIRDQLVEECTRINRLGLSMGMSSDYEVAIEEGATALRIGTAIVGVR